MNTMSKKAVVISIAMYLVAAAWIGLPYFGIIKQSTIVGDAFHPSAIFGMFMCIVLAGLFLSYRKEKVQPNGAVQTLTHVLVTAVGWLSVVFAPFAVIGVLLLIALHSLVFVSNFVL